MKSEEQKNRMENCLKEVMQNVRNTNQEYKLKNKDDSVKIKSS